MASRRCALVRELTGSWARITPGVSQAGVPRQASHSAAPRPWQAGKHGRGRAVLAPSYRPALRICRDTRFQRPKRAPGFDIKVTEALVKADTAEFPRSQASGFRLILGVLLFLANVAAVYVVFAPLDFHMPEYGLDPSWVAVLGEASAHGWRFGRDIIFTSGPLSSLYTHWFQFDHLDRYLAANVALIVVFALLVTTLAWRNRRIAAGFLVAAGISLCFFAGRNAIIVVYPLLVSLVVLSPTWGILEKASAASGVFCAALLTLVKFLVVPAAVLTFILCDIAAIVRRRWPFYTLSYVLVCFGF